MKTETSDITLNQEQRLYNVPCGKSHFSCLGFERCDFLAKHLAIELAARGHIVPETAAVGSLERYHQYRQLCAMAESEHIKNGFRSQAELTPELIGLEHKRVEVVHEWQPGKPETARFVVGKSTGYIPCHLELKSTRSSGGGAVCLGKIISVKILC
jgi:hypothetical protein